MTREWKPGDVALVTAYAKPKVAIVRPRRESPDLLEFAYVEGGFDIAGDPDVPARPLVVIDPEDLEQVERLYGALCARPFGQSIREGVDHALRSLLAPPRPEEPMGLGAVVLDSRDKVWINWRDPRRTHVHERPWVNMHDSEDAREYADIDVVRVLADGWAGEDR